MLAGYSICITLKSISIGNARNIDNINDTTFWLTFFFFAKQIMMDVKLTITNITPRGAKNNFVSAHAPAPSTPCIIKMLPHKTSKITLIV